MNKLGISDLDLKGRRVFMRVDFNVPLADGQITDDTRIQAALPSIRYVIEKNGKLILASHLGRPKGKPDPKYSLKPVATRLGNLLRKAVRFAPDCVGPEVEKMVSDLPPGGVLMLEAPIGIFLSLGEYGQIPAIFFLIAALPGLLGG